MGVFDSCSQAENIDILTTDGASEVGQVGQRRNDTEFRGPGRSCGQGGGNNHRCHEKME